jgi:hypothetical protein
MEVNARIVTLDAPSKTIAWGALIARSKPNAGSAVMWGRTFQWRCHGAL